MASFVAHDHVVLLLNIEDFESPPAWLSSNFTIIEGGTHSGGSSRNKLIVFKDGTYLELFNWIRKPTEFMSWANKSPGLIDFALTTLDPVSAEENYRIVLDLLDKHSISDDLGVTYTEPASGGRKRADGVEVRWKTSRAFYTETSTAPDPSYFRGGRIDVPFFCHDVTDRHVRVPFTDEEITNHPCGAVGIDGIEVLVPHEYFQAYVLLYSNVLGGLEAISDLDQSQRQRAYFRVAVPHQLDRRLAYIEVNASASPDIEEVSQAIVQLESDKENNKTLDRHGIGIRSLVLRTAETGEHGQKPEALADDPIGQTIKLRR